MWCGAFTLFTGACLRTPRNPAVLDVTDVGSGSGACRREGYECPFSYGRQVEVAMFVGEASSSWYISMPANMSRRMASSAVSVTSFE